MQPLPTTSQSTQDQQRRKLELQQWLQLSQTQLVLSSLRRLHLSHLRQAAQLAANPGSDDKILRLKLTQAALIETLTNKLEKGELDDQL